MKIKSLTTAAFTVAALSIGAIGAADAVTLNFDQGPAANRTGSLSYDGNGGALNGNNISFTYFDAGPGKNFVCTSQCFVNFTTGGNTSSGQVYNFGGGGSFSLTGDVYSADANGRAIKEVANGTILSGRFDGNQVGVKTGAGFSFTGSGNTAVNTDLLTFLGIPLDTPFVFLNTQFTMGDTAYGADGSISGNVENADLGVNDVPEPADLAMFGLGLVLLGGGLFARRRA